MVPGASAIAGGFPSCIQLNGMIKFYYTIAVTSIQGIVDSSNSEVTNDGSAGRRIVILLYEAIC